MRIVSLDKALFGLLFFLFFKLKVCPFSGHAFGVGELNLFKTATHLELTTIETFGVKLLLKLNKNWS